ncbi:MAG: sugar phosphate isomerase/epimerase [Oscillospiraceae bacterium]|nr:sugar phosphate isomerase/epimerase [Oscillospiraceae bacterium]
MKLAIGLQLYTLRSEIDLGYDEILKRVAETGYTCVEMTYDPANGEQVGELLKKYSLFATGAHIGIKDIEDKFDEVIKFAKDIGASCIVVPWIDGIDTEEKARATAQRLEAAAQKITAQGFEAGFHNHTAEFATKYGDKTVIDIFYEEAPTLKFQVDVGWAYAGGAKLPEAIDKLGDRLASTIHIKDVDDENTPTEIGSGNVCWPCVLEAAKKHGVKWGIVEQDACVNFPPFESVKVSYDFIKTIN